MYLCDCGWVQHQCLHRAAHALPPAPRVRDWHTFHTTLGPRVASHVQGRCTSPSLLCCAERRSTREAPALQHVGKYANGAHSWRASMHTLYAGVRVTLKPAAAAAAAAAMNLRPSWHLARGHVAKARSSLGLRRVDWQTFANHHPLNARCVHVAEEVGVVALRARFPSSSALRSCSITRQQRAANLSRLSLGLVAGRSSHAG